MISLSAVGGIFSILTFVHFFVDFGTQSEKEAMVKWKDTKVRAKHCAIYTCAFLPIFFLVGLGWIGSLLATIILFMSHMYIDTYEPVYLWCKYIRKPWQMEGPKKVVELGDDKFEIITEESKNPMRGFETYAATPIGKILTITIDQICHLAVLLFIAELIVAMGVRL